MPRVKISHVVSFSSEDPEHRAANLLATEVSKKKWLCGKGEPSCSVVLQLEHAVEISAVHIGAYHAAFVEVLVGLSEKPNDTYQVLVPSCAFVPPAQARRAEPVDRVRSFGGDALAAGARGRRYDRVRVVCSQPYNKHCKYGLSFVHIHEPEGGAQPPPAPPAPPALPALPARLFALDAASSDEEEFRPGELFAKHLKSPASAASDDKTESASTSAQIRQATSQALKNIPESSTKLLKTPISSSSSGRTKQADNVHTDRQRDSLMYTDDDDKPNDRIDRIVNRHKDERSKDNENKAKDVERKKDKEKLNSSLSDSAKKNKDDPNRTPQIDKQKQRDDARGRDITPKQAEPQKRGRNGEAKTDKEASLRAGPVCADESSVLRGVALALSGYEGARRARLRALALQLGARYCPAWGPACTHLVCAFPNTPKLRAVRAEGRAVGVACAAWLEACRARRRRLPWQWFATLPRERVPEPPPHPHSPPQPSQAQTGDRASDDEDTDDEIERAVGAKRPRTASPEARAGTSPPGTTTTTRDGANGARDDANTSTRGANVSSDSDVTFVRDERMRGHVTVDSDDASDGDATDPEDEAPRKERIDPTKALPDFFDGYTFVVEGARAELLARYVRAYGGLVLQASEVEDSEVHYVVGAGGAGGAGGVRVPAAWVWRCHRERRLAPHA